MRYFIIIDPSRLRLVLLVDDDLAVVLFVYHSLQYLLIWIFEDDVDSGRFIHFLVFDSDGEVKRCLLACGIAEIHL